MRFGAICGTTGQRYRTAPGRDAGEAGDSDGGRAFIRRRAPRAQLLAYTKAQPPTVCAMSESGFVYVIGAPSTPARCFVGSTAQNPARPLVALASQAELSTPFAVAYSRFAENRHAAEKFLFQALEFKGVKVLAATGAVEASAGEVAALAAALFQSIGAPEPRFESEADREAAQALELAAALAEPGQDGGLARVSTLYVQALAHEQGTSGFALDPVSALRLYEQAADRGHGPSSWHAAWSHRLGIHVPRDVTKAVHYFETAAQHGYSLGPEGMAQLYLDFGQSAAAGKCFVDWIRASPSKGLALFKYIAYLIEHPETGASAEASLHAQVESAPESRSPASSPIDELLVASLLADVNGYIGDLLASLEGTADTPQLSAQLSALRLSALRLTA